MTVTVYYDKYFVIYWSYKYLKHVSSVLPASRRLPAKRRLPYRRARQTDPVPTAREGNPVQGGIQSHERRAREGASHAGGVCKAHEPFPSTSERPCLHLPSIPPLFFQPSRQRAQLEDLPLPNPRQPHIGNPKQERTPTSETSGEIERKGVSAQLVARDGAS